MSITAVVLTAGSYGTTWPGLEVLVRRQVIRNAAELQAARFNAVLDVRTSHFFYLDDDDTLPAGHLDVLAECKARAAPLAYTDELVGVEVRKSAPYSQAAHLADPLLVHHLALYETAEARRAVAQLPRGHYCPEIMLAWQVAKRGAAYVPRIGYVWNKRPSGMHNWPSTSLSQMRALLWCKANP